MKKIMDIHSGKVFEENSLLEMIAQKEKKLGEKALVPLRYRNSPEELQIELTRKCNLKCIFCYNKSGGAIENEMSDEEVLNLVNQAIDMKVKRITFSGGEIFCRKETLKKCLNLCHEEGVFVNLITNGTLLTDEDMKFLSSIKFTINMIQISIDAACAEIHDKLRGIKGCWNKSIQNAYKLIKLELPVKLVSVISSENFDQIYDLAELAYLLKAKELQFGVVIKQGRAIDSDCSLNENQYERFPKEVAELYRYYKGKVNIYYSQPIEFVENKIRLSVLKALEIRTNGDVHKTCTSDLCFGSIKECTLREMWEKASKIWNELRAKPYSDTTTEFIVKGVE